MITQRTIHAWSALPYFSSYNNPKTDMTKNLSDLLFKYFKNGRANIEELFDPANDADNFSIRERSTISIRAGLLEPTPVGSFYNKILFVPVPSSSCEKDAPINKSRQGLFCKRLALEMGAQYCPLLTRGFKISSRHRNVSMRRSSNADRLKSLVFESSVLPPFPVESVVLVDDVMTQGRTFAECAEIIYRNIHGVNITAFSLYFTNYNNEHSAEDYPKVRLIDLSWDSIPSEVLSERTSENTYFNFDMRPLDVDELPL